MSENPYQRWFFDGHYSVAGRPKMEDDLMAYAKHEYLHCLVYETFLPKIVKDITERQEILWKANKRLKKVEVSLSKDGHDGVRWLYIGAQHLTLQKVKSEIEYL